MHVAIIKLTEAQARLVRDLIVPSPWYQKQAKRCSLAWPRPGDATLTFQFEPEGPRDGSDQTNLMHMTFAAINFGWAEKTCQAIRRKIRDAVYAAKKKEA
jgi:hypothetical protein